MLRSLASFPYNKNTFFISEMVRDIDVEVMICRRESQGHGTEFKVKDQVKFKLQNLMSGLRVELQLCDREHQGHRSSSKSNLKTRQKLI